MKILVLYDTKHGATADAAAAIAKAAEGKALALADCPSSLSSFDRVVLGAPVYFGRWSKAMTAFIAARRGELAACRLDAFVLGMMPNDYTAIVKAAFPAELAGKLGSVTHFGGRIDPEKLGFGERIVNKMVSKATAKEGQATVQLDIDAAEAFGRRLTDEA